MSTYQLLAIAATLVGGMAALAIIVFVSVRRTGLGRRPRTSADPRRKLVRHRGHAARVAARRRSRRLRIGLTAVATIVVAAAAVETITLVLALGDLNHGVAELTDANTALGTSPDGWTAARISSASGLGTEAQGLINKADRRISRDPLLRALRHLPFAGNQVAAAMDLSDTVNQGTFAFNDAVTIADAVDRSRTSSAPPGTRLLTLMSAAAGPWKDADARLTPSLERLRQDLTHHLLSPLAGRAQKALDILQPIDDLARVGAVAARYGPAALGADRPQNYLVLLPNASELRPAGGFSGSIGYVTVDKGAPATIAVKPQEDFNFVNKQHFDIPYPMGRYLTMHNNSLEIGDAGWDPDFPSTARLSEAMLTAATKLVPDNTISIDPYAFAAMLEVTGPVDVAGYGTFDSGNFFAKLNFIVNASQQPGSGKGALTPIGQAVLRKVLTAPASVWPRLFVVFQRQAEGRHIQAYFHDPHLAAAAAQVGYDGHLAAGGQDFLMVCDANVGATKGDYYVHKSMQVSSEVNPSGLVRHEVRVRYQMPAPEDAVDRALNPGDGSYRDYVRFYLPETATVAAFKSTVDGAPDGSLDSISFAHGRQVAGAFFRVPRGHEALLDLVYEVPTSATSGYQLTLQKQAGSAGMPTTVLTSYPGGINNQYTGLFTDVAFKVAW